LVVIEAERRNESMKGEGTIIGKRYDGKPGLGRWAGGLAWSGRTQVKWT
jgi:hypothetical protein